jgi:hypothetical protein
MNEAVFALVVLISLALSLAVLYGDDVQVPAGPVTVVTTAETLVVIGQPVTMPTASGKYVVRGWMDLTVGAGTTAITVAVYRGAAIGGVVIGQKNAEAGDFTPGSIAHFEAEFIDPQQNVSQSQYCISVTQTGATGNGTVQNALIETTLLSG